MRTEIRDQIRSHYRSVDSAQDSVEWTEIASRLDRGPLATTAPRLSNRRGLWVAVVAVVITVLLVGVIPLLFSSDGTEPADTVVPTTIADEVVPTTIADEVVPTTIADEVAPTTEIPHDLGFNVTWSANLLLPPLAPWPDGSPLSVWEIVGTSSVLLGVDRSGQLRRSFDGQTWEPILPELIGASVAADGELVVVTGLLGDGSSAIRVTVDGENWSEVDHTAFPGTEPQVEAVTHGGFVWLSHGTEGDSDDEVIGFIVENKLIDVYDAPRFIEGRQLVETSSGITAFEYDFLSEDQYSRAYSYLGSGEWSNPVDVPISGDRARVGDTILSFDHTNATAGCCAPGAPWSLMASEDGVTWTELSNRLVERGISSLEIEAGASFFIYGPNIHGGGGGIELHPTDILWISEDGTSWQPLDIEFMSPNASTSDFGTAHTVGNFIYVHFEESAVQDWIGIVETP